jgi:enoyl-[acyl-carrier protein] reductase II
VIGLLSQFDKIKMLSLFGAATEKLEAATIKGDLSNGVQFIGQSQGVINEVKSVQQIMDDVVFGAEKTLSDLHKTLNK